MTEGFARHVYNIAICIYEISQQIRDVVGLTDVGVHMAILVF